MTRNDGGPAFPAETSVQFFKGMTLRDYFAGQALMGLMTNKVPGTGSSGWQERAAWDAYSIADAMLAERSK